MLSYNERLEAEARRRYIKAAKEVFEQCGVITPALLAENMNITVKAVRDWLLRHPFYKEEVYGVNPNWKPEPTIIIKEGEEPKPVPPVVRKPAPKKKKKKKRAPYWVRRRWY